MSNLLPRGTITRESNNVISVSLDTDGQTWIDRQGATPPVVYLDTWALMDIAADYADRFTDILLSRGGTLALSWAGFVELSTIDSDTAAPVCALLRRIFPEHVVFSDAEAGAVFAKEDAILAGTRLPPSWLHQDWLEVFFQIGRKRSLNPLDPEEFLEILRSPESREALDRTVEEARAEAEKLIDGARARVKMYPKLRQWIDRQLPRGGPPIPATRYLYFEIIRHLIKGTQKTTRNHLLDFWHTVVPTACCNYVLLDRNWALIARRAQGVVKRRGLLPPALEAAIYSDVKAFLHDFECGAACPSPT